MQRGRELLEHLIGGLGAIRLEGIISKRVTRPARGATRGRLKVKCAMRQEFVVVGFLKLKGYVRAVRALALGYYLGEDLSMPAGSAPQCDGLKLAVKPP